MACTRVYEIGRRVCGQRVACIGNREALHRMCMGGCICFNDMHMGCHVAIWLTYMHISMYRWFPAGSKEGEAYQGGRTAPDLIDFVNKKIGTNLRVSVHAHACSMHHASYKHTTYVYTYAHAHTYMHTALDTQSSMQQPMTHCVVSFFPMDDVLVPVSEIPTHTCAYMHP